MAEGSTDRRGPAFFVAVAASASGALAEGGVAAFGALDAGGTAVDAVAALVAGFSLLTVVGLLPTLVVAWLLGGAGGRMLGRGLRDGLGGNAAVAVLLAVVASAAALVAGAKVGRVLLSAMTGPFAAFATAVVTVGALGLGLALVAPIGGAVAGLWKRVGGAASGRTPGVSVVLALLALAGFLVCRRLLPPPFAWAPTFTVAGLALASLPVFHRGGGGRVLALAGALGIVCLGAVSVATTMNLEALPSGARAALIYRAPIAGNLLAIAWGMTDEDGDDFSPVLLGGDCDDRNPEVYPGARDVPGNGIDESCSGHDAPAYEPQRPPPRPRPEGVPTRQNVVVVLVDALRPDHLSFAGYERETTPRLDRFRAGATWFENAYTGAPSTRFAMASAFTGYDARRVPHRDTGANRFVLEDGVETVAEILTEEGYDATGYTISYVIHHNRGLGQGYQEWKTPWPVDDWEANYPVAAEVTTDAVLAYLSGRPADAEGPYLLFAHYRCTHDPYIKHDEWDYGDEPVDLYDSALSHCDQQLGRVFDELEGRDDYDRTSVLVFSDHGELFGEHGLRNHGNSLFEPDVRIALLARIPGVASSTVATPVSIVDVGATVLDLAGIAPRSDADGWSLLTHFDAAGSPVAEDPSARSLFMFTDLRRGAVHHQARGVLLWPHKYLTDLRTGIDVLYDVEADPGESRDLLPESPELRAALRERLDAYEAFVSE